MSMAWSTSSRLFLMSTILAAYTVMSVAEFIATPTLAWAIAGLSLMPSPTNITFSPACYIKFITDFLSPGVALKETESEGIPRWFATFIAACWLSPVIIPTFMCFFVISSLMTYCASNLAMCSSSRVIIQRTSPLTTKHTTVFPSFSRASIFYRKPLKLKSTLNRLINLSLPHKTVWHLPDESDVPFFSVMLATRPSQSIVCTSFKYKPLV